MEDTALNQSVIIMTGMHRSGTSLTASLLQSAGINIGDRLMGADTGNPKGHFEDLDFVEFHQNVLQSQGINVAGWTNNSQIQVQQQYLVTAQNLILARKNHSMWDWKNPRTTLQNLISAKKNHPMWGWKDPRTTLFLDFWCQLIPHGKYIFTYRSPWEVVDSLFRRGDIIFRTNPNFAVEQWCNYNRAILNFYQRHQERCLLLEIGNIIHNPEDIIDLINQKFALELRSPKSLYEPSLYQIDHHIHYRQALITRFFPQAVDLYDQLQHQADRSSTDHFERQSIEINWESWILQDWNDIKRALKEKQQAEMQLAKIQQEKQKYQQELTQVQQEKQKYQQELTQVQQEKQKYQQELTQAQETSTAELAQSQKRLKITQEELDNTQQNLRQIQEQLNQSEKQLKIAQRQTEKFKSLVVAMESSKFWSLRQQWFKLKQKLNIKNSDIIYQDYLVSTKEELSTDQIVDSYSRKNSQNYFRQYLKFIQWLKRNVPQKALLKKIIREISEIPYRSVISIKEPPQSRDEKYKKWLEQNYPQPGELNKIKQATLALAYQPLISVIVPVYNPDESFLRQAIESVIEQAYPNWELCLADDCSTKTYIKSVLEEYAHKDQRIKVTFRSENGHICHASNSALELATGEYIALLDHDDLLAPHALATVVKLLNQHPEADFIYSDEDKVDDKNIHQDPAFKPDWCPDSFLTRMYTCHLGVYRRSLITEIGNFRPGFEGSQDYDLVLRVTEKTENIFHIPDILYHWRIHLLSTAACADAKPYAYLAGQKAISEAIMRRGEPGKVIIKPNLPGVYTVRYQIKEPKLVSIIIPTKDLADTLDVCLQSIFTKTTYDHYEVIVIDNGSKETKTATCLASWQQKEPHRFKCYPYDVPFNYSHINNYAVQQAKGDYLLFLNNDTEIITNDWMEAMVEQAQRPSIGAVGSLLLYPDETIQHAGVVLGIGGVANHSHRHFPASHAGYCAQIASINNYSAVTGACLMCRREVFNQVGGFEEQLAIAFNDVDFCLKIVSRGYRNIYLPHVVLYHYESKSRGDENTSAKQARFAGEVNYMRQKWHQICDRDPCYNPNLTKSHEDYSLNI